MPSDNRNPTHRRQDTSDNITVAGLEFPNPASSSTSSRASSRHHDSLQLSQETLDEHMRSQSRFNEQVYLRLHALETMMDKMLSSINEVHQRSKAFEKDLRRIQDSLRDAATLVNHQDEQNSDTADEPPPVERLDQKLARLLDQLIDGILQEIAKGTSRPEEDKPPEQSSYFDAPEYRHVNDEVFAELEAFAKLLKESRLQKLIFPNGSVQQARQDHHD